MPTDKKIRVNIGLGNGLQPDGTKPLPEPKLTYKQKSFVARSAHKLNPYHVFGDYTFRIIIEHHRIPQQQVPSTRFQDQQNGYVTNQSMSHYGHILCNVLN